MDRRRSWPARAAALAVGLTAVGAAAAAPPSARPAVAGPAALTLPALTLPALRGDLSLEKPLRLRLPAGLHGDPLWTAAGLFAAAPRGFAGLAGVEASGPASYDPSAQRWYAGSRGAIVRVEDDGRLTVLVDGVHGRDIDVRGSAGVAVSREPDDTIVLVRFAEAGRALAAPQRRVLLRGEQFFEPRLSPDGKAVLVAESRAQGGHFWVVDAAGRARDLGQGYGAVWHPDGKAIVFMKIAHDGYRVTASELWLHDLASGQQQPLSATAGIAEVEPTVSPDGRWLAYVDALSRELCIAAMPKRAAGGDR